MHRCRIQRRARRARALRSHSPPVSRGGRQPTPTAMASDALLACVATGLYGTAAAPSSPTRRSAPDASRRPQGCQLEASASRGHFRGDASRVALGAGRDNDRRTRPRPGSGTTGTSPRHSRAAGGSEGECNRPMPEQTTPTCGRQDERRPSVQPERRRSNAGRAGIGRAIVRRSSAGSRAERASRR